MTIYAAVRGGILYVATWSPGNNNAGTNDHFIFVSDQLLGSAVAAAPWAKAGNVAVAVNKPFIGAESATTFCGWFNAPASSAVVKASVNSGQVEGTIDLAAAFGIVPQTIYVASAAYQTPDGGALVAQGPAGNADGNIDVNEFMAIALAAIKDENSDGKYDRLDPTLDFVVSEISQANGLTTISWNTVPGKTYQVEYCDQLGSAWVNLGPSRTAGPTELTLSADDAIAMPGRFYRVGLVSL